MFSSFGTWLSGLLLSLTGAFVARALAALGISFITFKGLDHALAYCKELVISNFHSLPPTVINILGMLRIGEALTIIFSCLVASMLLNASDGIGGIKKLIWG